MNFNEMNFNGNERAVVFGKIAFNNLNRALPQQIDKAGHTEDMFTITLEDATIVNASDDNVRKYLEDAMFTDEAKGINNRIQFRRKATASGKVPFIADKTQRLRANEVLASGETITEGQPVAVEWSTFENNGYVGRTFNTVTVKDIATLDKTNVGGKSLSNDEFDNLFGTGVPF